MTAEQLNIIITAQTADFKDKIADVNKSLRETIELSRRAAAAAAKVGSDTVPAGSGAQGCAYEGSAGEAKVKELPASREGSESRSPYMRLNGMSFENYMNSADVIELDKEQTLIGAVTYNAESAAGQETPVEIHTTVELDGDSIGEAVASYNMRRNRITDGFSG